MKKQVFKTMTMAGLCAMLAMPVQAAEPAQPAEHHHENAISGFIDYKELQKELQQI